MDANRLTPPTLNDDPPFSSFRGRRLPVDAYLAGYSALIKFFDLPVPLHHEMTAIAPKNSRRKEDGWVILPYALRPGERVVDHLVFALKYEGVQLLTLKFVFSAMSRKELELAVLSKPTSSYIRRLCFLYEWFGLGTLDVPDTLSGAYVDVVDTDIQYASNDNIRIRRFKVRDNLPGQVYFCPMVFRTHEIDRYIAADLSKQAKSIVKSAPKELVARAAAFLLLSDSKASFAIEGESPPKDRIARWGWVIGKSGQLDLTTEELIRLQRQLIGDDRLVKIGLREEGGFVGRHDAFGHPEPEHLSADHKDLPSLLDGLVLFSEDASGLDYHPVLTAASVAFGFVYIHPFEDGNGRIHRFLMHHVLAERKFTPEEIVFPISSVILSDIARYKDVLERISYPLLEWIKWEITPKGNVAITGRSIDYYRYFDATAHAEFLFKCIQKAVETVLPEEISFLVYRDSFHAQVTNIVDMSSRTMDLLMRFLRQNEGRLSKRARENEFSKLSKSEIESIEAIYAKLSE